MEQDHITISSDASREIKFGQVVVSANASPSAKNVATRGKGRAKAKVIKKQKKDKEGAEARLKKQLTELKKQLAAANRDLTRKKTRLAAAEQELVQAREVKLEAL